MFKRSPIFIMLVTIVVSMKVAAWEVMCPQMEVESAIKYKRIVSEEEGWQKKEDNTDKPILMSCGDWKVADGQMLCYYGAHKSSYDYSVSKSIEKGVVCEPKKHCTFRCEEKKSKRNLPPKQRISDGLYRDN